MPPKIGVPDLGRPKTWHTQLSRNPDQFYLGNIISN